MKKVFLFLLASSALLSSCGSDDNGGSKRASTVTIQGGTESLVYGMTYDSKGRLSTMSSTFDGSHNYTFSYNDKNKLVSAVASGSTTGTTSFTYDAQGRLSSITRPGQSPMTITWSDATTGTFDGTTMIKLDAKGDLLILDTLSFTRDTGNGAFANVKVDPLALALVELQTVFFASKKPVKTIMSGGDGYFLTNSLESGYISGATFSQSGTPYTMTVTY